MSLSLWRMRRTSLFVRSDCARPVICAIAALRPPHCACVGRAGEAYARRDVRQVSFKAGDRCRRRVSKRSARLRVSTLLGVARLSMRTPRTDEDAKSSAGTRRPVTTAHSVGNGEARSFVRSGRLRHGRRAVRAVQSSIEWGETWRESVPGRIDWRLLIAASAAHGQACQWGRACV
jgi:hypothetical protein